MTDWSRNDPKSPITAIIQLMLAEDKLDQYADLMGLHGLYEPTPEEV